VHAGGDDRNPLAGLSGLIKVFKPPNVHRLFGNIFINRVAPYWWLSIKTLIVCLPIFNRKLHYYFVVCKLVNDTSH